MTLSPSDYRAWRAEAQDRDRSYAAGYQAGLADGHRHRDRLVALGIVAGIMVGGRRLRVHPVLLAVLVVALVPVLVVVAIAELTVRHHRRHRHWGRTLAYGLSWAIGLGLVVLAVASASAWPLVGLGMLVVAWTVGPRLLALARHLRGRGRGPGTGSGSPVGPTWPAPFTDADSTFPALPARPYRVTYTSKRDHVETRRYATGRTETVDTRTGEQVEDPFADV